MGFNGLAAECKDSLGPTVMVACQTRLGRLMCCAYGDGEDDFGVASQVGDVAVEGNALLCCASLAHSQGDAQDGISTKLG